MGGVASDSSGKMPGHDVPPASWLTPLSLTRDRARGLFYFSRGTTLNHVKKSLIWGRHRLVLETGEIARQATGAVLVNMEDTVVLVTVVGARQAAEGKDFLPLTVDYQERTYAAGKIPGGFFRREGRPSEKEILTCRLIDRPDPAAVPRWLLQRSAAGRDRRVVEQRDRFRHSRPWSAPRPHLAISGIPFNGPIGAARVGYLNGQYVLNPTATELKSSQLDLVVAGHRAGGADGGVGSEGIARGRHAGRRGVRPPADAGGDPGDQRDGRRGRRSGMGMGAGRKGRVADCAHRRTCRKAICARHSELKQKQAPLRGDRRDLEARICRGRGRRRRRPGRQRGQGNLLCAGIEDRARADPRAESRASTGAIRAPCGRSRYAPACCRARTAPRCSPAARRRRW